MYWRREEKCGRRKAMIWFVIINTMNKTALAETKSTVLSTVKSTKLNCFLVFNYSKINNSDSNNNKSSNNNVRSLGWEKLRNLCKASVWTIEKICTSPYSISVSVALLCPFHPNSPVATNTVTNGRKNTQISATASQGIPQHISHGQ